MRSGERGVFRVKKLMYAIYSLKFKFNNNVKDLGSKRQEREKEGRR